MRSIHVNQMIDNARFNKFFLSTYLLYQTILIMEGYDLLAFGVTVPSLMKDTGFTPIEIGLLASYGLVGMIFGSAVLGILGDKFGRKTASVFGFAIFCLFSGLLGFAHTLTEMAIIRFIMGLALGGVLPNVISAITEYTPQSSRRTVSSLATIGVGIGQMLAAVVGIFMLAEYGWRSIFWLGAIPLLLLPVYMKSLPESMLVLLKKGKKDAIGKTLARINPGYVMQDGDEYVASSSEQNGKVSFRSLFQQGFALNTVLFAFICFISLFMIFGITTWLPQLMTQQGYPLGSSLWFLVTFVLGSYVSVPVGGRVAQKYGYKRPILVLFLLSAVSICALIVKTNIYTLSILIFIVGSGVNGVQALIGAYIAQSYPLMFRSTAVGSTMAFGRLGGAFGPTIGGILLSMKVPFAVNFIAFAIPAVLGAILVMCVKDSVDASLPNEQGDVKIVS